MKKLLTTYLISLATSSAGNTKCQTPMSSSDECIYFLKNQKIYQYNRYFHGLASPDKGNLYHSAHFFENRQKCIRWLLSCTRWLLATPWKVWFFRTKIRILPLAIFFNQNLFYRKFQIFEEPSSVHWCQRPIDVGGWSSLTW